MNNNMPERNSLASRDWATRIQIHGILQKKPFGHSSNKWTKRFFLVRDGFLMYYDANEKKEYDRREFFNIHPKGVLPLGECHFKSCREPQQPFCVQIDSPEVNGRLVLSTESEFERDRWLEILVRSRRVTWKNSQLGDEMIRTLENQGLQMAIEKQNYIDRLQSEVQALSEEKMRTEELEKVNNELEREKKRLETFTQEIQEEYSRIKGELEDTMEMTKGLEENRKELSQLLDEQSQQLETLNAEKSRTLEELQASAEEQSQLNQERHSLSQRSEQLQAQLAEIESKTLSVQEEKKSAEEKLKDYEEQLEQLVEEKSTMSEHAHELESTIHDLVSQKEMTEKELKEEIRARMAAEKKLKDAEKSLNSLDNAVEQQSHNIDHDVKEEMSCSVKKLKNFFEDLALEAKFSSDQPLIIRNGLMARKTLARRAKTVRYENRRRTTRSCDLSSLTLRTNPRRATVALGHGTREELSQSALLPAHQEVAFDEHF